MATILINEKRKREYLISNSPFTPMKLIDPPKKYETQTIQDLYKKKLEIFIYHLLLQHRHLNHLLMIQTTSQKCSLYLTYHNFRLNYKKTGAYIQIHQS